MIMEGKLYLVATPIGNLEDISFRALKILKEVDIIAAEDTRHTRKLLNHFEIKTPLTSYYEHNKRVKGEYILSLLIEGKQVALVSDAGMPGISDPGEDIVREAVSAGISVCALPGPNAALTALVISGLPSARFVFEGFLPRGKKERKAILNKLCTEQRTMIFYEAPHRLTETLKELEEFFGERKAVAAREITKKFEETVRGSLKELVNYFTNNLPRGEFTLVVAGAPQEAVEAPDLRQLKEEIDRLVAAGMPKKEAIKEVAHRNHIPKRTVYDLSLKE
ncbi:MAG: 16S rRNA (cytidine(1402)-2'-O)-methyltransferase [Desulfitobacteriaceae bacterium]|nr:16S rRNA (cytidine(1402)-2'-O)-methyltransferase [Desulfitobacteriaceae bacterium]MDD4752543.1 16S rRNA (cytidine(1402)-2'-O)-methyltransferase [Desulfitobacteriaceae bacterium]